MKTSIRAKFCRSRGIVWLALCASHLFAAALIACNWIDIDDTAIDSGSLAIYLPLLLLQQWGLPVFAYGGWLAEPNLLGWMLGICLWLAIYYLIARLLEWVFQ